MGGTSGFVSAHEPAVGDTPAAPVLFMGQGAKWQQVNERADRNLGPWVMLAGGSCAVILFLVFSISRQRQ